MTYFVYPISAIIFKICLCAPATKVFNGKDFFCIEENKRLFEDNTKQDRMQALAVLCIESEIALSLYYDLIINKFVECKARKKIVVHE